MESNDGLNTILSSFEPVETKVWLEQITGDLRGKTIEDVLWEYDDDVSISPFAGSNAGVHQGSEIDFNADWEIAEEFQVSEETRANDQILISLRGGCETLILKVSSVPDWATLFRDVNLDMIRTYIAPPREIQEAIVSSLNSWLASVNVSSDAIAVRSDNIAHMGAAHEASKQTVVDQIVNTISSGLDLIDVTAPDDTIECIAEIGPYFYIEVARLRALRILWRNVLEALDRKGPQLLIETHMAEKFL